MATVGGELPLNKRPVAVTVPQGWHLMATDGGEVPLKKRLVAF
jgi:hypothetical protein